MASTSRGVVSRDIQMSVSVANVAVLIGAEAVSWSPDVADDMARRAMQMLKEAMDYAAAHQVLGVADEPVYFDDGSHAVTDDDDDDGV